MKIIIAFSAAFLLVLGLIFLMVNVVNVMVNFRRYSLSYNILFFTVLCMVILVSGNVLRLW
jgi:hypothetical protein